MTDGGKGGMTGFKVSKKHKKKLSELRKGDKNPNWQGKSVTDETRRLHSEQTLGKKRPEHAKMLRGKKREGNNNYVGVYKGKSDHYGVYISHDNKTINVGTFYTEIYGAMAHDRKSLELYGENAVLNFPELLETYLLQNKNNEPFEGLIIVGITNKHGYRGIYEQKRTHRWIGRIRHAGITYWLGIYDTPEEAALAYNKKAIELLGNKAKLNKFD